jgi:CHASE2 domain-containing sensor protein
MHGSSMRREALITVLVTVFLTLGKMGFQHTSMGQRLQEIVYVELQRSLNRTFPAMDLPVVVLDIGEMPTEDYTDPHPAHAHVSRSELLKYIDALRSLDPKPRAIGIDVDFSQDNHQWIAPRDPEFFDQCLSDSSEVPIFLGVGRGAALGPDEWLGSEKYQSLAAGIWIPREGRSMFESTTVGKRQLGSMSTNLATRLDAPQKPALPQWSLEQVRDKSSRYFSYNTFLIDYSPIDTLERERVNVTDPQTIRDESHRFSNKVVLIGWATYGKALDTFSVPGKSDNRPIPGVLVHAAAVYSRSYPLYEFKGWAELLLDVALVGFGLSVVWLSTWWYARSNEVVAAHRLEILCSILGALLVLAIGLAIRTTRMMWDGFLLSALVLLAHPFVPYWLERIAGASAAAWRQTVLTTEHKETM